MTGQLTMELVETSEHDAAVVRAKKYVADCYAWILANPARFCELQEVISRLHNAGAPIQQGRVQAECARLHIQLSDSTMFSHDRNLWPCLARIMRALYPSLKKSVAIRKSAMDELEFAPLPPECLLLTVLQPGRTITRKDWE